MKKAKAEPFPGPVNNITWWTFCRSLSRSHPEAFFVSR
jgi:hypothetical protein